LLFYGFTIYVFSLENTLRKYVLINVDISTFILHHESIVNLIHSYVEFMQISDIPSKLLDML